MMRPRGPVTLFLLAAALAAGAWLVGFSTALYVAPPQQPGPEGVEPPANFELFRETWDIVEREYYGEIPEGPEESSITHSTVEGLVEALGDPYAAFLDSDAAAETLEQFRPEMVGGIGAWIEPVADGAMVVSVVPDTPAERIGLEPGDHILAVGTTPTARLNRDEIIEALRGKPGSSVVLVIQRRQGAPFTVEAIRDDFELPTVEVRRPSAETAYLRISHFGSAATAELDEALRALQADPPDALVIDLRDNPGGALETVRQAAGRFFDGQLYVEIDREGNEAVRRTQVGAAPIYDLPDTVVVLVNEGTASGAEMLAGLLDERVGARLVGTSTFGKGGIQAVTPLSDGSILRLTVAEWRTPGGVVIEGKGLKPDLTVAISPEDREAGVDTQLEAALRAARSGGSTAEK